MKSKWDKYQEKLKTFDVDAMARGFKEGEYDYCNTCGAPQSIPEVLVAWIKKSTASEASDA